MKKLLLFLALSVAGMGFSASIDWASSSVIIPQNNSSPTIKWSTFYINSAFANGTAYIVQAQSDWTQNGIASYLQENGLMAPEGGGNYVYDSTSITGASGYYYVNGKEWLTNTPSSVQGDYFVIVVSSDGKTFAVSSAHNQSQDGNIDINTGNADNFWSATGTLGGGDDPNVPEPTALALLALGVAGVALRRRVA